MSISLPFSAASTPSLPSANSLPECPQCSEEFHHTYSDQSPNRTEHIYSCSTCETPAVAGVELTGPVERKTRRRLEKRSDRYPDWFGVDPVAAFLAGEYTTGQVRVVKVEPETIIIGRVDGFDSQTAEDITELISRPSVEATVVDDGIKLTQSGRAEGATIEKSRSTGRKL